MFSDEHALIIYACAVGSVWLKTANRRLPPTKIRSNAAAGLGLGCLLIAFGWAYLHHAAGNVVGMAMIGISFIWLAVFIRKKIPCARSD